MFSDNNLYKPQLLSIIESGNVLLSDIKPSDWTERNMVMQKPFPGPFKYSKTPYTREIIDCLMPDHPARWVAVMKGAQIGFSSGVIYPGIGWIIKNHPANTAFIVGAPDLVEKAMGKVDLMIDSTGLRNYIRPQALRNRNNKSGDTNLQKEFPGGYVMLGSANNHKNFAQVDWQIGFFDDFERFKKQSESDGDIRKLIEQRFASYADTHKIFYISTPQVKGSSNIEPAYELGDKRKFLIPCPCCHEFIELKWNITEGGGIVWELDNMGKPIKSTVGYVCQNCACFFKDNNKHEQLNEGYWNPTCEPSQEGFYSYHISSLYAPLGMYDWWRYVNNYVEANPVGQPRKEGEWKVFVNTCLGETYEPLTEAPKANSIQKNTRLYNPGEIPEKLSMSDGNGRIVLITCAADMNGKVEDARLDYEVVAHSEKGPTYSIMHGSIGTFVPREGNMINPKDRAKWTYEDGKPNSVFAEFDKIVNIKFTTDTGRKVEIMMVGLDCGFFSSGYAYPYVDRTPKVIGLKGKGEDEYLKFNKDIKYFTPAKERPNLYILTVGKIKDDIAEFMQLGWNDTEQEQPYGFMNFPTPSGGMYQYANYFEHFESEHCITEANKDGIGIANRWQKKSGNVMNHMWDCRVYNLAIREIILAIFAKELKQPKITWRDWAAMMALGIEKTSGAK